MKKHVAILVLLALAASAAPAASQQYLQRLRSGRPLGDRFRVDSAGGVVATGALGVAADTVAPAFGPIPAEGPGSRMMWYPFKAAFRAGWIDAEHWDDGNVGAFSWAGGSRTLAAGAFAFAFGEGVHVSGTGGFSAGFRNQCAGFACVALGFQTRALGAFSFAGGQRVTASGNGAFAFGDTMTVSGASAVGFGQFHTVSGMLAAAFGSANAVSGNFGFAAGSGNQCGGVGCVALGRSVSAGGQSAFAAGLLNQASGDFSVALGQRASTNARRGSFVFADASRTDTMLVATADNQFVVRAAGGVSFSTVAFGRAGVSLSPGGSSWNALSDRHAKEDFLRVDGEELLARLSRVPVTTWRYRAEADRSVRHIGPMAQDWHAAFGFGPDDRTINMSDLDGVNLAAAQALERRTRELRAEVAALRAENAAMRAERSALLVDNEEMRGELAALLRRLEALEARLDARP